MTTETATTYTPLTELPGTPIGKCNALLPNHMQCWRAGDVLVKVTTTDRQKPTDKPTITERTYQLCRHHAVIEQMHEEKH